MVNKGRYARVRKAFQEGQIQSLEQLLVLVKITNLKADLHTHLDTLKSKIDNPELFLFGDAYAMSDLIGIPGDDLVALINKEVRKKRAANKKKSGGHSGK
jgi:hypothetical protein